MRHKRIFCLLWGGALAAMLAGHAAAIERVAVHRDWVVYEAEENGSKLCYATSPPTEQLPADRNHGNTLFFVVNRPSQDVVEEPHFRAGYNFRPDSKVNLRIGDSSFTMFTIDDGAWLENAAQNRSLIDAMKGGAEMQVTATSSRGTNTSYRFSLLGVTKAIETARSTCQ